MQKIKNYTTKEKWTKAKSTLFSAYPSRIQVSIALFAIKLDSKCNPNIMTNSVPIHTNSIAKTPNKKHLKIINIGTKFT